MVTVSRNRVFNDNHLIENTWVKVWYGFHAKERLEERSKGTLAIRPEKVRLNRKNITKGYIENGKLIKFVVKIPYNHKEDLYLVLTPSYYMPNEYFVKSLWFGEKLKVRLPVLQGA